MYMNQPFVIMNYVFLWICLVNDLGFFQARIWDVGRCYLLHTLKGHRGAIYCIDMDTKGDMVITGSSDKVRDNKKVAYNGTLW